MLIADLCTNLSGQTDRHAKTTLLRVLLNSTRHVQNIKQLKYN